MRTDALARRIPAPLDSGKRAALLPESDADDEALAKIPLGELVGIRIVRSRSLPQLKLYWAIVQHVAENSKWETKDNLHRALRLELGYYDLQKWPSGKVTPILESTAFDNMTHDEFTEYMEKAINAICSLVIPGTNRDDLVMEVQTMLGSTEPPPPPTRPTRNRK